MKSGIRFKIFIPVFLILIIFPIASFAMFGMTSKDFMNASARRDLDLLVAEAGRMIAEAQMPDDRKEEDEWPERVKTVLQEIKVHLKTETAQADMMIFNSKYKLIYPKLKQLPPELTGLYDYTWDVLKNGKSRELLLNDTSAEIDGRNYLLRLLEMPGDENLRAKYLVAYIPVQDHTALIEAAGRLVFLITAGLAALSCVAVWLVAGNMQRPLQVLCRHAENIGQKDFAPMEQEFSIREIEALRQAVNEMSAKLGHSEQAQSTFFQNVSHELRTPLMSICGYAQGIQKGVFPDAEKAAGVIASESLRLKELVDGILTISRLDNDRYPVALCQICLNDFMEELVEKLGGVKELKEIQVRFENPESEIYVSADSKLLLDAVQNVLSNCLKYADKLVNIRLYTDAGRAVIRVEDDGGGFQKEDLPHVFERFYKGKKGNFGIGLSIAETSVHCMSGTIEAMNGEKGAVFLIAFPIAGEKEPFDKLKES